MRFDTGFQPVFRLMCLLICVAPTIACGAEQAIRLLVDSGPHVRQDCPITINLPDDVAALTETWTFCEIKAAARVPHRHQFLNRRQKALAWILTGETPAKSLRTFELRPPVNSDSLADLKPTELVVAAADADVISIRHRDRPVLTYHLTPVVPPEGSDPKYGRSGHMHPVRTPDGEIVSDELPPDHMHQSGLFLAYVKTEFQGRQPDFWNLAGGTGFVRSGKVLEECTGPVCGGFRVPLEHVARHSENEQTVVLREEWDVCCWNADDHGRGWRFDITSRLRCAADSPLMLKEYHYGGMAFRGARGWTTDNCQFITPEGKSREAGNHGRVPWVDLSGKTGDRRSGITVFTDPANFRFPEPVRLHPTMPYFVFTPAVLGDWSIEPERTHVSRYHYWIHDGEFRFADAERIWAEISDPPRVALRVVND